MQTAQVETSLKMKVVQVELLPLPETDLSRRRLLGVSSTCLCSKPETDLSRRRPLGVVCVFFRTDILHGVMHGDCNVSMWEQCVAMIPVTRKMVELSMWEQCVASSDVPLNMSWSIYTT